MKIKKITLKNFFRFGNNEQTLDLDGTGISCITAPNGYGKSTAIVDSILFAFYAKYRTPKIDDVVNRYTKKNCKVSVEFEQDGKNYKVIRYRAHDTHKNNVYIFDGEGRDISGHTAQETNQIILDIIRTPYIAFTNSAVFSTELYSEFLKSSSTDRLTIFENILSLKEITLFYLKCKDFIKDIQEKITDKNTEISSKNAEINVLNSTINNYSENAKRKLLELKSKKEDLKNKKEAAEKMIKDYGSIDVDGEKSKLTNNILKNELDSQLRTKFLEKRNLVIEEPTKEFELVRKYENVNFYENKNKELKYNEDLDSIKAKENGINISRQRIMSLNSEIDSLTKELGSNTDKLQDYNKSIEHLLGNICPFCKQKMNSEDGKKKLEEINHNVEILISSNEEIESELADKKTVLEEEREMFNYLTGELNKLKLGLNKNFIPNSDLIEEQFKNAKKITEDFFVKKNEALKKINQLDEEIDAINNKINNLEISAYTEEELNNLADKIKEQNEIINSCNNEIISLDASAKSLFDINYVKSLKEQIENNTKELEVINSNKKILENDLLHYEYLQECFSNKSGGFKKYFIGNMIDLFNEKVNQYLPFFFTEDVKIKFDKDLNDKITVDGLDASFESFSQGQRQRAELSVDFALFDVARIYFSNDNNLLVLDEVDKGLDKYGIKAMISLLEAFDNQLRIFVVSHNPLLDSEINDKIKIERDSNGFSIIKM